MKGAVAFITGNSKVTLAGVVLAAVVAIVCEKAAVPQFWTAVLYVAVLLATLAASTYEPMQ